ncbi:hypothetical protein J2X20_004619 [Pelomonas saccharophila]|uniref:Uncharacterized protein n=1 Tax=Roseateles saccharophilus TaxID=304 RepID=A0ABU1YSV6_ROSSA|nr:hypothetical protein [Roseateles saccharophilus]MDR7271945.1 hypothetical protein [Roseateles saccharophilus]
MNALDEVDALEAADRPDRPFYDTGVLLGSDDFRDEQTYHRSRLARALAYLAGAGTLIGLKAAAVANEAATEHELKVGAGLAIDRLGRLIEVPRSWCVRLEPWFLAQPADALRAAHGAQGVVADLFLRFTPQARGRTPSFAQGAFDATDALVPNRVRDAFRFELVLRPDAKDAPATDFLPRSRFQAVRALDPADRPDALRDALLDGWNDATNDHARDLARPDGEALPPLPEHGAAADGSASLADPTSLFLARLLIPTLEAPAAVPPGTRPTADFTALDASRIDNTSRRFAYPADALAAVFGI